MGGDYGKPNESADGMGTRNHISIQPTGSGFSLQTNIRLHNSHTCKGILSIQAPSISLTSFILRVRERVQGRYGGTPLVADRLSPFLRKGERRSSHRRVNEATRR